MVRTEGGIGIFSERRLKVISTADAASPPDAVYLKVLLKYGVMTAIWRKYLRMRVR